MKLLAHYRIPSALFIHAGSAMSYPLAYHEYGRLDMELEHYHLKGSGVVMPKQVANESPVLAHALGSASVRDPRGLHDTLVAAHVVYQPHEAVARHEKLLVQQ